MLPPPWVVYRQRRKLPDDDDTFDLCAELHSPRAIRRLILYIYPAVLVLHLLAKLAGL